MIARLTGSIAHRGESFVVIEAGGIGYKVFVTGAALKKLEDGKETSFWTYLAVRENALDLFGFEGREELELFEILITVPGIGPKTALNVLNVASAEILKHAVFSENTAELVKVSGIGKKTAEKIVLELRGKLGAPREVSGKFLRDESDALEALVSLGYSREQVRQTLKRLPQEVTGTNERVKHALKLLSGQ
ncbi:Holliday junction branch migration protein RuvA [Patescibacteria group bacterium]|nr:MAG: Holliday junction branch migration protein RuvA [Patescibacteria group bacterium]